MFPELPSKKHNANNWNPDPVTEEQRKQFAKNAKDNLQKARNRLGIFDVYFEKDKKICSAQSDIYSLLILTCCKDGAWREIIFDTEGKQLIGKVIYKLASDNKGKVWVKQYDLVKEVAKAGAESGFVRGFACACATMLKEHDDRRMVEHCYSANFHTEEQLRDAGVEEYDIDLLKPIIKEIERKRKL